MSYNIISKNAYNMLIKHENFKEDIIFSIEILQHDGYDIYGPESNLWTLYIIIKEDDSYILYRYYYEDWYHNKNNYYVLELKTNIKDIQLYDLEMLEISVKDIIDSELKYILESKYILEKS